MPVVPPVLNRIYDNIMAEANKSILSRLVLDAAVRLKTREVNNWIMRNNSCSIKLCSRRSAKHWAVVSSYGQTECVAAATISIEGDSIPDHVGVPAPCCAIKLLDVPEQNYFARDGAGEVCVKGPNVFRGYYKMPEAVDADEWLHTGDIGRWTQQGTLKIVDRKKHE
uniref:long-chain-fatty-acid--CoA ligase n=1 Tax=Globodera pallida TaxID=36090 RepID=A0A183CE50_GLOPA